ncbi:MAG: dipeptidase [Anaerolineae bacterium]|nr:dipeptidase [Anaerolineae bacterium]
MSDVHHYVDTHFDHFRAELHDLIRIPGVSTLPERAGDIKRAAEWLATNLHHAGLSRVEIMPTPGHPIVYGEWMGAGENTPTVLIYGHYDVQPADKSDGWNSEPFEPLERDGFIIARGSSDDKGQVFAHVKAVESLLANGGKAPVNFKFLIEGEEEIGSPNLTEFIVANRDLLKADVCVISDSGMPTPDQPSIVYALRGMVALEVEVYGPSQDLHSGSYGGAVHNPIQALVEIVAQLHNPDGSIAVPGFYDDVLPLSEDERTKLSQTAVSETDWVKSTGVPQSWGEPQYAIHERTGARPTLEINGLAGGFFGEGFKNVIPAKAWAKISCRLVANQNADKIPELVRDYILKIAPPTIRTEIRILRGAGASFVDINHPSMQAAIDAYEQGWGKQPIFMREGGSIPVVSDFQRELGLPVILMGFGLNNDGAHGPNEHFNIEMFRKGIHTAIYFYEAVGKKGKL